MGDILVKEKMKLFPLWYNSKTSNIIIQGIGRGVRNENDYCTTYILDACFYSLYINTKDQYSPELQNRIKIVQ
jgi:Rad3-related DNA helicase